ncbi:MAG: sulfite exporter TauE/SafE family protein [Clostridia bacterium]|nr:sulfite exporter TauE/SafE family protein [Clostridia bacterium]MBR7034033.1 sulfite exporter TauE/SafE family protein [Clostridia bacterium]
MDLFDIPAAFLIGALTGTGVGGGGLLVLYLTFLRGVGQIRAQWLNLVLFTAVSAAAVPVHLARRKIDASVLLILVAFAIPGTFAGSAIRDAVPAEAVRRIFGSAMLLTGAYVLFKKDGETVRSERGSRRG